MSYNESLKGNSNYPVMSQCQWDEAPFNEPLVPDREFEVTCSQSLSKTVTVTTNDYIPSMDGEDDTSNTNWAEEYGRIHYTPFQLIGFLRQILKANMKCGIVFQNPGLTNHLIKECEDWIVDDTEFVEE